MLLTEYKALKAKLDARDKRLAEMKMAYEAQVASLKLEYADAESQLESIRKDMLTELAVAPGERVVINDPDGSIELAWRRNYELVDANQAIGWLRDNGYEYAVKPAEVRKSEFNAIAKARYEAGQSAPDGCVFEEKPILTVRLT